MYLLGLSRKEPLTVECLCMINSNQIFVYIHGIHVGERGSSTPGLANFSVLFTEVQWCTTTLTIMVMHLHAVSLIKYTS